MNKFKKGLIMALAVGVLMMGSVFGADTSKSFVITTTIPAMAELKIHKTADVNTIADFNNTGLEQKTGHTFGSLANDIDNPTTVNSGIYYLSVKTNAKIITYIKVSFNKMIGKDDSNTLDYTLKYGAGLTPIKASSMSTESISLFAIPAANGARVVSNSFSIDILGEDIETAVPDDYKATITFEYTAT